MLRDPPAGKQSSEGEELWEVFIYCPLRGSGDPPGAAAELLKRKHVWQWLCRSSLHQQASNQGTVVSWQTCTHIQRPPVSQDLINRAKQQVLSLCLSLTANYEALQVSSRPHMQHKVNPTSSSTFHLCSLFIYFSLRHKQNKNTVEMLTGHRPPPWLSTSAPSPQEQQHGERWRCERG